MSIRVNYIVYIYKSWCIKILVEAYLLNYVGRSEMEEWKNENFNCL